MQLTNCTTENYLKNIAPKQDFAAERELPADEVIRRKITTEPNKNKIQSWVEAHPTLIKVTYVAAAILGVAAIVACPFLIPLIGLAAAISLSTGITLLATASIFSLKILNRGQPIETKSLPPNHHDMANHVFTPGEYEGGKLFYHGHVPILSVDLTCPYKAGKAHGYLLGNAIEEMRSSFKSSITQAAQLGALIKEVKKQIPQEYLEEMQGVVDGFNEWSNGQKSSLTLDQLLLLHLIPDSNHLDFLKIAANNSGLSNDEAVACTAVVDGDENNGLTFARTLDWVSRGVTGKYSLVIKRKAANGKQTAEVGLPGFIGTLTGMNQSGLSLCMNICNGETNKVRGMPAVFFNRMCLEKFSTVKEVQQFVKGPNSPLGPYHMTVASAKEAAAIHFYQGTELGGHKERSWQLNNPLFVTNQRYGEENPCHRHASKQRQAALEGLFKHATATIKNPSKEQIVAYSITLPYVNTSITTNAIIMRPGKREMDVAFDNTYAAARPLQTLNDDILFN